jgi:hypothetical protein
MSLFENASLIVTPNGRKVGKIYALKPFNGSGDLDVVRATTATYVGADGLIKTALANEVRFDYTNGSCPSILVEPQRTNLLLRSEEFDNASWIKVSTTITTNSTNSPSGTLTADSIFETTANDNHGTYQTATLANATAYTYSFFVKPNGRNWVSVRFLSVNGVFVSSNVWFDILNGTIGTKDSGITATIQESSNGFYKITATRTTSASGTGFVGLYLAQNNNSQSYTGIITNGVYICGAQLEAGSNATSYIPTVASAVTRNADVISKTGISDLINSEEGVFYTEIAPLTIDSTSRDIEISDGNTNRVILQFNNTGISAFVIVGGVVQASLNFNNSDTDFKKVALKYKVNDFALFVNGVKIAFDTSGATFPPNTLTGLDFKKVTPSSLEYYGKVKALCLWKTALTDTQLTQLTTP